MENHNRILCVLLSLVLAVSMAAVTPVAVSAAEVKANDSGLTDNEYGYYIDNNGTAVINYYVGSGGDVIIPSVIDGYNVTGIGWLAFEGCTSLMSVTIPDTVIKIEMEAFYDCQNLKSVIIPDSVASIGENAFGYYADGRVMDDFTIYGCPNSEAEHYANNSGFTFVSLSETTPDEATPDETKKFELFIDADGVRMEWDNHDSALYYVIFYKGPAGWVELYSTIRNYYIDTDVRSGSTYTYKVCAYDEPDHCCYDYAPNGKSITYIQPYDEATSDEVSSPDETSSDFGYDVLDDGTAEISDYYGDGGEIDIPSSIDGYTVTSIGWFAFYGCTSLTSISIPDSVTIIDSYAFCDCTSLESVALGNSVTEIRSDVFRRCTSLTSITIPDSVASIGSTAFFGCTNLKSVTIPGSVTSFGDHPFYRCTSLTDIDVDKNSQSYASKDGVLFNKDFTKLVCYPEGKTADLYCVPDSVTSIGDSAFYGCTGITIIDIPDSVTSIGGTAFYGCTNLSEIGIPDSVSTIGSSAFYQTAWYDNQPDGLVYAGKVAYKMKGDCPVEVEITPGTKEIADSAFSGCSTLKSVTIPESVLMIGFSAFSNCTELKSVVIPKTVAGIGDYAFGINWRGDGYNYTKGFKLYGYKGSEAERYAKGVKITFVPLDETTPSEDHNDFSYAFVSDDTIEVTGYNGSDVDITIPSSIYGYNVTSIGDRAFRNNTNLTSVNFPDSITSIGYGAFENCSSLAGLTIPDSVMSIGSYAFSNTAWYNNQPDGLVYVGRVAYKIKGECPAEIIIKDGTVSIAYDAFNGCEDLISIIIPDSVLWFGNENPKNFSTAFNFCTALEEINVNENNSAYASVDGVVYNKNKTEIVVVPKGIKTVEIPDSVTSISNFAFEDCGSLARISIPDSVTSIGGSAFYGCTNLMSVIIPDSVTSIGDNALGYYTDDWCTTKVDGFTIYGYPGSEAERYADDNGFTFVTLGVSTPDEATPDEVILGDVDGDGEVKITDATYVQRKIAQIEIPFEMNDTVADVDGDGQVTLMDATYIQRWLANLKSKDYIGKPLSTV